MSRNMDDVVEPDGLVMVAAASGKWMLAGRSATPPKRRARNTWRGSDGASTTRERRRKRGGTAGRC